MSAGDVAAHFAVSRPAISRHLRVLRAANLVIETRRGRHRVYELNAQPLQAVDGWLDRYRTHWTARLMDLKNYVESQSQDRAAQPPPEEQAGV